MGLNINRGGKLLGILAIGGSALCFVSRAAMAEDNPGPPQGDKPKGARPGGRSDRPPPFPFKEADANGDGQVAKEEFVGFTASQFDRMDANHDGKLDEKETRHRPPPPEGANPLNVAPKAPRPEQRSAQKDPAGMFSNHLEISQMIFKELDTNGDGKLQKNEAPPSLAGKFDGLDSNHDGALGPDDAGMMQRFQDRKGYGDRAKQMKKMDANGDGKIQKSEATPPMARMFDRLDKNKDGELDKKELRETRMEGRPGQPGAKPPKPGAAPEGGPMPEGQKPRQRKKRPQPPPAAAEAPQAQIPPAADPKPL